MHLCQTPFSKKTWLQLFSLVRLYIDTKLLHERSKVQAGEEATEHANLDLTWGGPQLHNLASPACHGSTVLPNV